LGCHQSHGVRNDEIGWAGFSGAVTTFWQEKGLC
jgi:hypothetical protein